MIVTLTPNPSIDHTSSIAELRPGEVHRATDSRIDPGGKGVNVSRVLLRNGYDTLAVLPLGGPTGRLLDELLTGARVPHRVLPIAGNTRTNIALIAQGQTTKINETGPEMSPDELVTLAAALPDDADWIVLCGSLPAGAPDTYYAQLVAAAPGRVAVDASGAALRAAVAARPSLIKPNREELAELVGAPARTLGDVLGAARDLARSIEYVVVSLGADGALLVHGDDVAHASAHVTQPRSTVGVGDCLLAGVLAALVTGQPAPQALACGVAWGSAAVQLPGSAVPGPHDIARVAVRLTTNPDPSILLTD